MQVELVSNKNEVSEGADKPRARSGRAAGGVLLLLLLAAGLVAAAISVPLTLLQPDDQSATKAPWATEFVRFPHTAPGASGLDKPASVSADGTHVKQECKFTVGEEQVVLEYDATVIAEWRKILDLDHDARVKNARCAGEGKLRVEYESTEVASSIAQALPEGALVTGSYLYGCSCAELGEANGTGACTLQHHAKLAGVEGQEMVLEIEPAGLGDFFEELHVRYRVDPIDSTVGDGAGEAVLVTPSESEERLEVRGRRAQWWNPISWFSALFSRLRTFSRTFTSATATAVLNTVQTVANFVDTAGQVASGNLALSGPGQTFTVRRWHGRNVAGVVDLSGSSATINAGVDFSLDLSSWVLQQLTLSVRAGASVTVDAQLGGSWSSNRQFPLSSQPLGHVTFAVGPVPFHIAGFLDIDARVQASAAAATSVRFGTGASTNARYGVQYQRPRFGNGGWSTIAENGWTRTLRRPTVVPAVGVTADVGVAILPTLYLSANWIGGPTATLAPYAAAEVGFEDGSNCGAVFGWGVDAYVGARIDVRNPLSGESLLLRQIASSRTSLIDMQPLWACDCSPSAPVGGSCDLQ